MLRGRVPSSLLALKGSRDFRWLWASGIFTAFEDILGFTAVSLYVLNLTGSGGALAATTSVAILAGVVAGPIAGVVADRFNRKRVWLAAAAVLTAAFALYPQAQNVEPLLALIAVASVAVTFARNAALAMLPDVVDEQALVDANALLAMNFNVALTIAPLIAGGLVAASGAHVAFYLLACLRIFAAFCVSRMNYRARETRGGDRHSAGAWLDELRAGVRYAREHAGVRWLLVTAAGASLGAGALPVLEVVLVKQVLNAGDAGYGLFLSVAGVGAVGGSLLIRPAIMRWSMSAVLAFAVLFTGLTFFPIANILWYPATLAVVAAQTVSWVMGMVLIDTLIQKTVPRMLRGRIFGFLMFIRSAMALVAIGLFGPLVDRAGVVPLLNASGVIYTGAGVYAAWKIIQGRLPAPAPAADASGE